MKNHLGRTIGVIQVLNKKRGDFTETDSIILAALATQAAISIDNSRLFLSVTQKNMQLLDTKEQLEHRVRDLKLLFDLESAMGRATSMDELFNAVLHEAMRVCEARAGAVLLREETGLLTLHVRDGKHAKLRRFTMRDGQGLIGWAMRNNEVLVTNDALADPRRDTAFDEHVGFDSEAAIAVPIEGDGGANAKPLGAIALYNKKDRRLHRGGSRPGRAHHGERLDGPAPADGARGPRARGAAHDDRAPALGGHSRSEESAHGHQRLRPADAASRRARAARRVRRAHPEAVRPHLDHAARGARVRARREERARAKGLPAEVLSELKTQLEALLARHDVELVVDVQDKGTARFDEGRITRAVYNLARNAAEAMGEPRGN